MLCVWRMGEWNLLVVAFVVVEHDLEEPRRGGEIRLNEPRDAIAVLDALQIPVSRAVAVALIGQCPVDPGIVLRRVLVDNRVALVVVARADQPCEDPRWMRRIAVGWIEDARIVVA